MFGRPRARVKTITPKYARKLLDNTPQKERHRELKNKTVLKYADQMRTGKWKFVGKSVVVDSNGKLRNGQHRLTACVLSGIPFKTVLVTGVDPKEFD